MGKNGYWITLDDKYKSLDEWLSEHEVKVRTDAIDECISKINSYISHPQLISAIQVIVRDLEKLKEHKNE